MWWCPGGSYGTNGTPLQTDSSDKVSSMHGNLPSTGAPGCHAFGKSMLWLHYAGEQFESTKSNTPKLKFGTSLREASEKVFISTEHEKSGYAA